MEETMTHQSLLNGLDRLRLSAFRTALEEQLANPQYDPLPFEERLLLLVDRECQQRDQSRIQRRLKQANLPQRAFLEEIDFSPGRGLQRSRLLQLADGSWLRKALNLIILGPTGAGKTYVACALGRAAIAQQVTVRYFRMPRFFQELRVAQMDGSWVRLIRSLAKTDLLIFDDWLRDPLSLTETQLLLDILDDRYNRSSTLLVSQYPVGDWHLRFQDPTLADAILDRLVHNAHRIELVGESQRKLRSDALKSST
jgi:DNA replication protein DnaC